MGKDWFSFPWRDKEGNKYDVTVNELLERPSGLDSNIVTVRIEGENNEIVFVKVKFTRTWEIQKLRDEKLRDVLGVYSNNYKDNWSAFIYNLLICAFINNDIRNLDNYEISFNSESKNNANISRNRGGFLTFSIDNDTYRRINRLARDAALVEAYPISNTGWFTIHELCEKASLPFVLMRETVRVLKDEESIVESEKVKNHYKLTSKGYKYVENKSLNAVKNQVFLIAECEKYMDVLRELIYNPVVKELDLGDKVFFVEDNEPSETIQNEIWKQIESSKVIICDFTNEKPNCYIEYGYAYRHNRKNIVLVSEYSCFRKEDYFKPPFDISQNRFTFWHREWIDSPDKFQKEIEEFKKDFKTRIQKKLDDIAMDF